MFSTAPKDYEADFDIALQLVNDGTPFAFSRFSDGELYMMQGKPVQMLSDRARVGSRTWSASYPEDDWKEYDPAHPLDALLQKKLIEAFTYKQHGYVVGVSCRCCVGEDNFQWQLDLLGDYDLGHLSWANLWYNGNYRRFVDEFIDVIRQRPVVLLMNKAADPSELNFDVVRRFDIGSFCTRESLHVPSEMLEWTIENDVRDHIFLFAASALSNLAIHKLYEKHPYNIYLDIGSALNPFLGDGIKSRRTYMQQLSNPTFNMPPCIW